MPRLIEVEDERIDELGDLIEALEAQPFDPRDEDAFGEFGVRLKRLANNRVFLAELISRDLRNDCASQGATNAYGAQVIMLHAGRSFIVRANIWPEASHSLVRANGPAAFFYDVPHDHNMSFLTVGYAGPGYWSDDYEFDYASVRGTPGETVDLRFVGRSRLEPGRVELYRSHRDVHSQQPPERLSVSLNVMEVSPATPFRDQYIFDVRERKVAAIANPAPLEPLLAAIAVLGGGDERSLLDQVATTHPCARARFAALSARARAADTVDGRIAIMEEGTRNSDAAVRELAVDRIARLEQTRVWVDNYFNLDISKCSKH